MTTQYTANFSLPYPQLTDTPNVPRDIQALATAIDGISIALKSGNLSQFASTTSAQLSGVISDETGTGSLVFGTSPTLSLPVINNFLMGYTTVTVSGGTTTLTNTSNQQIYLLASGSTTHTVKLPSTATLALGEYFDIVNITHLGTNASVTIQSNGGTTIATLGAGQGITATVISTTDSGSAWNVFWDGSSSATGSGSAVFSVSPVLVTPSLGVASGTSLAITATGTAPTLGVYSSGTNILNFSTASTNQFFIDSAGDIWDLTNSTQTSSYLRFGDGTNTYGMFAGYYDSSTTGHIEIYTMGSGTITERMRIDNAGNMIVQGPIQTYATSTTSTNSVALALSSGNATGTTSNSGAVTIDVGTATGTAGTITIGGTNASGLAIGRSAVTTTINGTTSHAGAVFMTGGITYLYQPAITTISTSGASTLTIAQLLTEIINYTGTNTATFTLPTGTLMDGGITGIVNNVSFDWSIVNTVAFAITMSAGTSHTYVGNTTVAANVSARFRSVRTATTTWVTYRLS